MSQKKQTANIPFYEVLVDWSNSEKPILRQLGPCTHIVPMNEIAARQRTTKEGNLLPGYEPRAVAQAIVAQELGQEYAKGWRILRVAGPLSKCEG